MLNALAKDVIDIADTFFPENHLAGWLHFFSHREAATYAEGESCNVVADTLASQSYLNWFQIMPVVCQTLKLRYPSVKPQALLANGFQTSPFDNFRTMQFFVVAGK